MSAKETSAAGTGTNEPRDLARLLLAFGVGALVGIGVVTTWLPERKHRRRPPPGIGRSYHRARDAGAAALGELRSTGRALAADFREELGAGLEAAREEFSDMARQQLDHLRKALRQERKKPFG